MEKKKKRQVYAQELIEKANASVSEAKETLKGGYDYSYSNVISNCQQAIELSVKAIFKLMDINFPKKHEIDFKDKNTKELLDSVFPQDFQFKEEIPRLIFLTQFWKKFYLIAKYGIEDLDIAPNQILRREDAELAIIHAKQATLVALHLKDYFEYTAKG